jgi:hypothetical protein
MGEACRPCSDDAECAGEAACVLRTDFTERVCLLPCAASEDCLTGFICDPLDGVCVPPLGGCTQLRRSLDRLTCMEDAECVARGETAEPMTCGLSETCLAACDIDTGCPGGWRCDGVYCQPIAEM